MAARPFAWFGHRCWMTELSPQDERAAARALLDQIPKATIISRANVEALVDHLGGLSCALARAQPEHLEAFYRDFGLSMVYDPYANAVDVTIRPPLVGAILCPRGDSYAGGPAFVLFRMAVAVPGTQWGADQLVTVMIRPCDSTTATHRRSRAIRSQ